MTYKKMMGHDLLAEDEINKLVVEAKKGCEDAVDLLVRTHMRLLGSIAHELIGKASTSATWEDLVGYGVLGLLNAIKHWEQKNETHRFTPYAAMAARNAILNADIMYDDFVHLPGHKQEIIRKIASAKKNLPHDKHTNQDIADYLDIDVTLIDEVALYATSRERVYLDAYLQEGEDATYNNLLGVEDPYLEETPARIDLAMAVEKLNERENYVLCHSHGIFDYPLKNNKELAQELGVTEQGIYQIRTRAEKKVKQIIIEKNSV